VGLRSPQLPRRPGTPPNPTPQDTSNPPLLNWASAKHGDFGTFSAVLQRGGVIGHCRCRVGFRGRFPPVEPSVRFGLWRNETGASRPRNQRWALPGLPGRLGSFSRRKARLVDLGSAGREGSGGPRRGPARQPDREPRPGGVAWKSVPRRVDLPYSYNRRTSPPVCRVWRSLLTASGGSTRVPPTCGGVRHRRALEAAPYGLPKPSI
jgi:hypothetical protein